MDSRPIVPELFGDATTTSLKPSYTRTLVPRRLSLESARIFEVYADMDLYIYICKHRYKITYRIRKKYERIS